MVKLKKLIEIGGMAETSHTKVNSFIRLNQQGIFHITGNQPLIEQILKVQGEVLITKRRFMKTPTQSSLEGRSLTGQGLRVEGETRLFLEYLAKEYQSIHGIEYNISFCDYIMLPKDLDTSQNIAVTGNILDIDVELLAPNQVFLGVCGWLECS